MSMRKVDFDWKVLDTALQFGATLVQCGHVMDCSHDTIERHIKKEHSLTFTEYREKKFTSTKLKLIQTALQRAFSGKSDTMLIFCLKNVAGWKNEGPDEELEKLKTDLSELMKQLTEMKAKGV